MIAWSLLTSTAALAEACTTDEHCSLNGQCAVGACLCLAAWSGPTCGVLNVLPARLTAGLHSPASASPSTSSWGGSVAFDRQTGLWQMYAAEMTHGCGIGAWETNSRIVRAVADQPDGEYRVVEVTKPTFAYEPVLAGPLEADDGHPWSGRWLLYSIGNASSSDEPRTDCRDGYTPTSGGGGFRRAVPVEIFISDGTSPAGPWGATNGSLAPLTIGEGDINPAPLVLPNGTTLMMWRGGDAWFHVHLARAQLWNEPYSYSRTGTIFPGWDRHGIEDPFVYQQPSPSNGRPTFHAIFHDHSTIGGHAFSVDGISWTYSPVVPFNATITYEDGSGVVLQRRERPHLIFDKQGYITHLTSGVQPPPSSSRHPPSAEFQNDYTYTLVVPVRPQPASRYA